MLNFISDFAYNYPNFFALIIIVLSTILLIMAVHHIRKNIFKFVKKKPFNAKKIVRLENPLIIIILVMGLQAIISNYLRAYPSTHSNLNNLLVSLSIVAITYMLALLASILLENWSNKVKRKRHDVTHEGIVPLLKSVVDILLGFIALIFILQTWDVSVGALLTSLGIAGVILGFAFRDTLTNVFGGISLILDDTFRKGDLIELGDGEIGFVLETSLRSTKLKNFDGEEVYVPNSVLSNMKIKNYAQPSKSIRIKIIMPVALGTDISKVEKLVFNLLDKKDDVLKYPRPKFFFVKVADYYLELAICFFINDYRELFVKKSDATREIYELFMKHKIEIPYPIRTIRTEK